MKGSIGRLLSQRFFDNPIFIVGAGRSGTSVLLQALGKHPCVLAADGEAPLLSQIGELAAVLEEDYHARSLHIPDEKVKETLRRLSFESCLGRNYGFGMQLRNLVKKRSTPRFWSAKTFPSSRAFSGLQSMYPPARFIYIIRNGIDVVHSRTKFSGFRDLSFEAHCNTWASSIENYAYLSTHDEALVIKYEDLLCSPAAFFGAIWRFLDVPSDPAPINFVQTTLIHPPLDETTKQNIDVKRALMDRPPAYNEWSSNQKSQFKQICGIAMEKTGYDIPF